MNQNKLLAVAWLPVCAVLLLTACDDDDKTSRQGVSESDVKANYVKVARAMYADSLLTAKHLQADIETFLAMPTEENLLLARAAYKAARIPYQQSEIMRWDTDITLGSDTGVTGIASVDEWEGQVNAWPLDESLIDYIADGTGGTTNTGIISGNDQIDRDLLINSNGLDNNEANVATGVHAIEFLLWGQDTHGTDVGAGVRPASDYDINNCSNNYCERRRSYLKVATELLVEDLTAMNAEWTVEAENEQGTLAYNYLNSQLAIDYMWLAMRSMATDELAGARMGSGLELLDPEEEHDCFSDLSHVAIYNNFQGVKNAFYGRYGDIEGASIADLVKQKDSVTFTAIDNALMDIEVQMKALLDLGEQTSPVRFDQIIGEGLTTPKGANYLAAVAAVDALVALDAHLITVKELLSLQELSTGGAGDGD